VRLMGRDCCSMALWHHFQTRTLLRDADHLWYSRLQCMIQAND
jgi:hypothetical protein